MILLSALALPAFANHFDDTMKRVRLLSESPNVRLLPFGRSARGRAIPAFVLSDFSVSPADKARLLVVAGQHGDEHNPVQAIMALSRDLAAGSRRDLLGRCVIIVVPMANPDGIAANQRLNASGVDINRDWLDRNTREARCIHQLIRQWRPQAIIDAHEWNGPSPVPANGIELPLVERGNQHRAMGSVAQTIARTTGLTLIRDTGSSDGRLLHRRYASLGYASYMLETAPGESYANKSRAYATAIVQVAESLASSAKLRSALSPSAAMFSATAVGSYLEPAPVGPLADPESSALALAATAVAAYCLMMWVLRPLAAGREAAWSRKFRKCSIDWDASPHPMLRRRSLQPITSRSSANRRLRARYVAAQSPATTHQHAGASL